MTNKIVHNIPGLFDTNITNYRLSDMSEKIKNKNAEYYKKSLFLYIKEKPQGTI